MKKILSLAALFSVLSYVSPASAEVKFGGEAAVRLRAEFNDTKTAGGAEDNEDDLKFQYRVRLKASADLGSGYYFKALLQSEETAAGKPVAGGWADIGEGNAGAYNLEVSNFYFGRNLENSHYALGRLPLGSFNNPIFDLLLYPTRPVDTPVSTNNFDRLFGFQYGFKIGGGELNTVLGVLDNNSADNKAGEGNGLFNDGYGLYVSYKTTAGNVTIEPAAFISLTNLPTAWGAASPHTFGANVSIPAGNSKISLSGFYTIGNDTLPNSSSKVDYSGYLFRVKGESGPLTAWIDLNRTDDNSDVRSADKYENLFVWASYNFKVYDSAAGTFSLTPTVRYRASGTESGAGTTDNNQLRTELYATVTF